MRVNSTALPCPVCGGEIPLPRFPSVARTYCSRSCATRARSGSRTRLAPKDRLLAKLEYPDGVMGCWLWTGATNPRGYGHMGGSDRQTVYVHRVAYEVWVGQIPDGLQLDHLCRVKICVNPLHLELVTGRENMLRGVPFRPANIPKTHCPQGHPYNSDNTYVGKGGRQRQCRICRLGAKRRWRSRHSSIPALAKALGVKAKDLPMNVWPDKDFDTVWVLRWIKQTGLVSIRSEGQGI